MIQANAKVEHVSSKKLDEMLAHQKPFSDKNGLGYIEESSFNANVSKEMKFVKVKETMWRLLRSQLWLLKRFCQNLKIHLWAKPSLKGSLYQSHKEVLKLNIFATIVEFEDTLDLIVIGFMHWKKQILKDQEDKEKGIGMPSNQKGKKSIPVLVMWWRW